MSPPGAASPFMSARIRPRRGQMRSPRSSAPRIRPGLHQDRPPRPYATWRWPRRARSAPGSLRRGSSDGWWCGEDLEVLPVESNDPGDVRCERQVTLRASTSWPQISSSAYDFEDDFLVHFVSCVSLCFVVQFFPIYFL